MKDHPIIFNGEMVRAILARRKMQTRWVIVPQPICTVEGAYFDAYNGGPQWNFWTVDDKVCNASTIVRCPYGVPGDRLWVRETFMVESNYILDSEDKYPPPFSDGRPIRRITQDEDFDFGPYWEQCHYKATDDAPNLIDGNDDTVRWRSSKHMPRWASRINMEVVNVRVERVQDISEEDAKADGGQQACVFVPSLGTIPATYRAGFERLWNSLNAKRGYGWDKNPWVWVIEFDLLREKADEHPTPI